MRIDYRRLGRYMTLANIAVTGLVIYIVLNLFPGEAAQEDYRDLLAPVLPSKKAEPRQKSIFKDYSGITVDRFLPAIEGAPGEPAPLVPIPGAASALERLMKLRGTAVSSEKELSCAIIELLQGGESRTVRIGEEIAGVKVLEIGADAILVSMDNEEITLPLDATEEYGTGRTPGRVQAADGGRGAARGGRPGDQRRPGRDDAAAGDVPQRLQQFLQRMPEDARAEALNRWQNASPEERQQYLRLMENRAREGRTDPSRQRRPARNRQ
jgi:hypothetical protein